MKVLFLFLDGIGLGTNDPQINPFARVEMPHLQRLLGDKKLVLETLPAASAKTLRNPDRISLWPKTKSGGGSLHPEWQSLQHIG